MTVKTKFAVKSARVTIVWKTPLILPLLKLAVISFISNFGHLSYLLCD